MIRYRLHWTCHPKKDAAWYAMQCERLSEDEVARELDINYALSVSGRVFTPFREDRHVVYGPLAYNPDQDVYRIWDFGKTNAVLYGQMDAYGRKRVLHERVLSHSGTVEQYHTAMSDCAQLFGEARFVDICDPAGQYAATRDIKPEIEYLHEHGILPRFNGITAIPTRERKRRGIELILRDLQESPGGQDALLIHGGSVEAPGCPILKKAFSGAYCYKKDYRGVVTDQIREKHPYEDVMDCLIYWVLETHHATTLGEDDFEPTYSQEFPYF